MNGRVMRDTPDMPIRGVVRVWHRDQGWGVIDSQDTPGGCWAHFSSVLVPGYRELRYAGRLFVPSHRGVASGAGALQGRGRDRSSSAAYRSTLTITFDDPDEPGLAHPA